MTSNMMRWDSKTLFAILAIQFLGNGGIFGLDVCTSTKGAAGNAPGPAFCCPLISASTCGFFGLEKKVNSASLASDFDRRKSQYLRRLQIGSEACLTDSSAHRGAIEVKRQKFNARNPQDQRAAVRCKSLPDSNPVHLHLGCAVSNAPISWRRDVPRPWVVFYLACQAQELWRSGNPLIGRPHL